MELFNLFIIFFFRHSHRPVFVFAKIESNSGRDCRAVPEYIIHKMLASPSEKKTSKHKTKQKCRWPIATTDELVLQKQQNNNSKNKKKRRKNNWTTSNSRCNAINLIFSQFSNVVRSRRSTPNRAEKEWINKTWKRESLCFCRKVVVELHAHTHGKRENTTIDSGKAAKATTEKKHMEIGYSMPLALGPWNSYRCKMIFLLFSIFSIILLFFCSLSVIFTLCFVK